MLGPATIIFPAWLLNDGNGDRHTDREDAPWAIRKRIDHDDTEPGQRDQKNKEHGDHCHQACERTDFSSGNIRQ